MSAHSEKYENVISLERFKEKKDREYVQSLCHIKKVFLVDGTKAQMEHEMNRMLLARGINDDASQRVFRQSVRNGILLYSSMVNRDKFTIREAIIMIEICLLAIANKKDDNDPKPFIITKADIQRASNEWNVIQGL